MGELERISDALDHSLSSLSFGRRASDKKRNAELAAIIRELETYSTHQTTAKSPRYSSDEILHAIDLFFELLMQEKHCSPALMMLLGFLQRPVTQSVQSNPSFLINPKHYARRLIKALFVRDDDMSSDSEYQTNPVYMAVHEAIKKVVTNYDGDDRLFLQAYYEVINA